MEDRLRLRAASMRRGVNPWSFQKQTGGAANLGRRVYGVRSTLPIEVRIALRYSGSQHASLKHHARAERGRVAKRAAHVIPHPSPPRARAADRRPARPRRKRGRLPGAIGQRQTAAMQVEAGDGGELGRSHIRRWECPAAHARAASSERAGSEASFTKQRLDCDDRSRERPTTSRPSATKRFRRRSNSPSDMLR